MRHNIVIKMLLISSLILIVWSGNVLADEDEGLTVSGDTGIFTKYIWRGYDYSNGNIVIQPSLTMSYKGLSLNDWANIDTDSGDNKAWNETDVTLSYDTNIGPVALGGGYVYYDTRDSSNDTQELYVSAGYDTFLSPTLTVYRDIDLYPGYYFNLGVSQSFNLTEKVSLDLSAGIGYSDYRYDYNVEGLKDYRYSSFHDGMISAGLTIPLNEYLTLSPSVSYSFPLTDEAEDDMGNSGNVYGGIVLSVAF
jgi:hypothetical protein